MKFTSIIMTAYNQTPWQCHMTMAALANVTRYTPTDSYELILMDADPKFEVRNEYKVLKIDQHIKTSKGYTASMNEGASLAKGDYLVFLQNDVFVPDGWLENLSWYLDNGHAECVFPDQVPRSREFVLKAQKMDYIEAMKYGSRDAGLLMITKEAFKKTGGWDEELSILCDRDFYDRMGKAGVTHVDTCKVMISHIMAATNLDRLHTNPDEYNKMMEEDAGKLN